MRTISQLTLSFRHSEEAREDAREEPEIQRVVIGVFRVWESDCGAIFCLHIVCSCVGRDGK